MTIASSIIVSDSLQIDGRRWIEERHTDQYGIDYLRLYLVETVYDIVAALSAYALQLDADLTRSEIERNVLDVATNGSLATPRLFYSTAAQNFTALRNNFALATQVQAIMIGDFLNTLTNAQLQAAFDLTVAQVNALRTNKLQPAAILAADIRLATGA